MMTSADRVYELIKSRILNGQCSAGSYVRESTIGREYSVSRTPIREALRRLVSEGWAEAIPHHGVRVVAWTQRDVEEVFELRALLEPHVVRRASSRVTVEQFAELRSLAKEMEEIAGGPGPAELERITALNACFHDCLIKAADSPRLQRLFDAVVQVPVSRRSFHHYTHEEMQRSMQHHRELIRALSLSDGEWAASIMRAHVLGARAAHLRWTIDTQVVDQQALPNRRHVRKPSTERGSRSSELQTFAEKTCR